MGDSSQSVEYIAPLLRETNKERRDRIAEEVLYLLMKEDCPEYNQLVKKAYQIANNMIKESEKFND